MSEENPLIKSVYARLDDDRLVQTYVAALREGALFTQQVIIEICNESRPHLDQKLWDANLEAGREMEALERAESAKNT